MTTYANVGHVLLKRGNTVQSQGYTGPLGELTYDTDLGTVRVHNNAVAGGVNILATQAEVNSINANLASAVSTIGNSISTITGIDATFVSNINTLLANAAVQSSVIGNLQAFQTYANATFGTSSFGNADVASYLVANPQPGTYSNANVASYLPTSSVITTINANITGANAAIVSANTAMKSYVDSRSSTYSNANVIANLQNLTTNVTTTANVTAGKFIGDGSRLSNVTVSIAGNIIGTQPNVTLVAGNYSYTFDNTGNVTLPANVFVGVTNTFLPNTVASFSANVNYYSQVTLQNKNSGNDATADYVVTADNGSDTVNFLDLGIINSGYDNTTPSNSLGNIVFAADSYIYAQGNTSNANQSGGNLAIGTVTTGKTIKFFTGGTTSSAIAMTVANTGVTVGGNITATGTLSGSGSGLTGVALKTTGSWTVTTGTGTYSFTVPASGTYQLWVDCNIPNGILVWNATATITNTNVPVVGAQYAWVYNGGGSPIDFTSIPNQFTGTGNTIVRSSVAPSATTNRFDFGFNNTSGGNVTVRYGWIQIG